MGFSGPLCYNYNKEPPKVALAIIEAPILYHHFVGTTWRLRVQFRVGVGVGVDSLRLLKGP